MLKLRRGECLGEEVGGHVLGAAILKCDVAVVDSLANEMVADVDVFSDLRVIRDWRGNEVGKRLMPKDSWGPARVVD